MALPGDPIVLGTDNNLFRKVTVDGYTFPEQAQVIINFKYQAGFSLMNESNFVIEYSFNGNTLHGDLTPGLPSAAIIFDNRSVSKIWFRAPDGGDPIVRVEAWAGL